MGPNSSDIARLKAATFDTIAWLEATYHDAKLLDSDIDLVLTATSPLDIESTGKYCDKMAEDARTALQNSQRYTVSTEIQQSKNYYELGLTLIQSANEQMSKGCTTGDANMIKEGVKHVAQGFEYIKFANKEIDKAAKEMDKDIKALGIPPIEELEKWVRAKHGSHSFEEFGEWVRAKRAKHWWQFWK